MSKKKGLLRHFKRHRLAVAACITAYLVWPYFALYRVGDALRHGDVAALTTDVDWDSVREGLKEDIADQIVPRPVGVANGLPPFGSGFATAMAGTMIDRAVTPDSLAERQGALQGVDSEPGASVRSAWFSGLTQFDASFQIAEGDAGLEPVRVHMDLVQTGWLPQWQITRVWIPMPVLKHLQSHST
jgi:hypothetical protein